MVNFMCLVIYGTQNFIRSGLLPLFGMLRSRGIKENFKVAYKTFGWLISKRVDGRDQCLAFIEDLETCFCFLNFQYRFSDT